MPSLLVWLASFESIFFAAAAEVLLALSMVTSTTNGLVSCCWGNASELLLAWAVDCWVAFGSKCYSIPCRLLASCFVSVLS